MQFFFRPDNTHRAYFSYISNIPLYSQQGRRLICSRQAFDYSFTRPHSRERRWGVGRPGAGRRGIIFWPGKMVLNFCPLGHSTSMIWGENFLFSLDRYTYICRYCRLFVLSIHLLAYRHFAVSCWTTTLFYRARLRLLVGVWSENKRTIVLYYTCDSTNFVRII